MSANNPPQPAGDLPPIPEDVLSGSEQRMKRRQHYRAETKRKIAARDFKHIDNPDRLRARVGRVLGDPVSAPEAVRVTTTELESQGAGEFSDVLLERIIGGENFVGVRFFDLGQRAARAVVRIDIRTPEGRTGSGTGSMVSSRLLLTNNHVLKDKGWAQGSSAVFDFEDDFDNKPRQTVVFQLDPDVFFFTDENFDFTLVAVRASSLNPSGLSLESYGFNPLDGTEGKVAVGEPINIIQHPSGLLKQAVLQENRLLDLPDDEPGWLHYETDTQPGSSGAPLFNNRWEMVGLHHAGWPKRNEAGQILTVDDKVWTRDMGELAIKWLGNEGTRVSQILKSVSDARSTMDAQRQGILTDLLTPTKIGTVVVPSLAPSTVPLRTPSTEELTPAQSSPSGGHSFVSGQSGVTITLPLHITVSLGSPAPTQAIAAAPTLTPPTPTSGEQIIPTVIPDTGEAERAASMREFAEASTRPYYDAAADKAKRDDYFRATDMASNVGPDALFHSLSKLITTTHQNRLPYKPARHLYPWVDIQPDRKLHSLYTADVYEPQDLIEESFALEARFEAVLESLLLADQGEGALPLLEAGPAFNCEHVVPRSWFKGPTFVVAEGDLHHLFTCHSGCNSFRGNVPYWDFPGFEEAVMEGCGRRETDKFEPSRGKGAAARAVLYFLLRYPGLVDDLVSELQANRLATIIGWHKQDDVSDYERHRNAAIQEKQGNRNPLIDFPDLVSRINFKHGLKTNSN